MVIKSVNIDVMMVVVVAVASTAFMLQGTEAAEYTVGDDLGWTIPPDGAAFYQSWATNHPLVEGDIILFNFTEGEENVAAVTQENFDTCNTTDPLFQRQDPIRIKFLATGTFHFICTFAGHCSQGQKIAINIGPSFSPTPSPIAEPEAHRDHHPLSLNFVAQKMV